MRIGKLNITAGRIGKKVLTIVRYGKFLVWQLGTFFTSNGEVFVTKDGETFNVKEEE
jgi:hypothetical protein